MVSAVGDALQRPVDVVTIKRGQEVSEPGRGPLNEQPVELVVEDVEAVDDVDVVRADVLAGVLGGAEVDVAAATPHEEHGGERGVSERVAEEPSDAGRELAVGVGVGADDNGGVVDGVLGGLVGHGHGCFLSWGQWFCRL
jgi:hypothetical protein